MTKQRKWLRLIFVVSALAGNGAVAIAAPKVFELRMSIVDPAGKTLASPKLQLATGKEATIELLVEGWKTNITVVLNPSPRANCRQLKVDFNEEKTGREGESAHRAAATTSDVCDSKSMIVGDEKARKLLLSVHELPGPS